MIVSLMESSILSEVDYTSDSQDGALHPAIAFLSTGYRLSALAPAQRAVAQRLCALARPCRLVSHSKSAAIGGIPTVSDWSSRGVKMTHRAIEH